ncbi:MAG: ribonuclease III [Nitrospinales bacterium]
MITQNRLEQLACLENNLNYKFNETHLMNIALTHKSYANEFDRRMEDYERFEFLGDSVLDLIVGEYSIRNYLQHSEGALSKIRAAVVNESCLAKMARKIDLGQYLLLGRGEENSGGRKKSSLLANAFESVTGAIFFDSTFSTAHDVILPFLKDEINQFAQTRDFRDFKSELQEYTQNKLNCVPSYKVVNETGPDHDKVFEVAVMVRNEKLGEGQGRSKKEAEQVAAKSALKTYNVKFLRS